MWGRFTEWVQDRRERKDVDNFISAMRKSVSDSPSLPSAYESYAEELVKLGKTALNEGKSEVRKIEAQLNTEGGVWLMRDVLHRAESSSLRRSSGTIIKNIEVAWDGIGSWMA